ncbi:histidinol-phosphate transaminase [Pelagibacteraceae bacterium]|nr:histidinol-phosphate transaminase [Pelagibacteraceae bacterium]
MENKELENLRSKINNIDDEILSLLSDRSKIVLEIGKHKKNNFVVDLEREQTILNRLITRFKGYYSKDTIVRLWREIFQSSEKIQKSTNVNIQSKRSIDSINVYKGGKSKLNNNKRVIKLSSNENPYGPSPKVIEILKNNTDNNLHRYPEIDGSSLREVISQKFSIDSKRIILGSGSDEVLLFAALAFCQDGDEILHANHGFEMYSIVSKVVGAVPKKISEDENFNLNIEDLIGQTNDSTKVIYIASPNNPTGTYLSRDQVVKLMKNISKNIVVVIDGAYVEYVEKDDYDKGFSLADEYENIILTRTFSKTYGLAALRVGWCYTSQKIADIINKIKPPFNTTTISQSLAIKALEDKDHIINSVKLNSEIKNWFENELKLLNIKTRRTEGNFTLIESSLDEAEKISNHLMNDGIIIRRLNSYNLPNFLRISIGTEEEMKMTVESLKKLNV